jgi:hypothetical protein
MRTATAGKIQLAVIIRDTPILGGIAVYVQQNIMAGIFLR